MTQHQIDLMGESPKYFAKYDSATGLFMIRDREKMINSLRYERVGNETFTTYCDADSFAMRLNMKHYQVPELMLIDGEIVIAIRN